MKQWLPLIMLIFCCSFLRGMELMISGSPRGRGSKNGSSSSSGSPTPTAVGSPHGSHVELPSPPKGFIEHVREKIQSLVLSDKKEEESEKRQSSPGGSTPTGGTSPGSKSLSRKNSLSRLLVSKNDSPLCEEALEKKFEKLSPTGENESYVRELLAVTSPRVRDGQIQRLESEFTKYITMAQESINRTVTCVNQEKEQEARTCFLSFIQACDQAKMVRYAITKVNNPAIPCYLCRYLAEQEIKFLDYKGLNPSRFDILQK